MAKILGGVHHGLLAHFGGYPAISIAREQVGSGGQSLSWGNAGDPIIGDKFPPVATPTPSDSKPAAQPVLDQRSFEPPDWLLQTR